MRRLDVCTDHPELAEAIGRYLSHTIALEYVPVAYTYDDGISDSDIAFRKTALFIFDLFRTYPEGRRAEGIAAARACIRAGKPALIVSVLPPPCGSGLLVWGPFSDDTLQERLKVILEGAWKRSEDELKRLHDAYSRRMSRPSRH
jgi:hypothetical protein